jgi:hypothetical protein
MTIFETVIILIIWYAMGIAVCVSFPMNCYSKWSKCFLCFVFMIIAPVLYLPKLAVKLIRD